LAWIHRAEARGIAAELGAPLHTYRGEGGLLRLSDPAMLRAIEDLTRAGIPYIGPGLAAMRLCYDKLAASERVAAAGIDCPAQATSFPMVIKPRRGSDSIGVRIARSGPIPADHLAQERLLGMELTVGSIAGIVGAPLRIVLRQGALYSFSRKYLRPPRREVVSGALADRVRDTARRIATLLGVDWAARVDFIYEARRDRLCFLECDVAPLVGAGSAFAASLRAGGMPRAEQLRRLTIGAC
jgi:D-alanine-D-alanine ligase-like ATP-grasp enzyme